MGNVHPECPPADCNPPFLHRWILYQPRVRLPWVFLPLQSPAGCRLHRESFIVPALAASTFDLSRVLREKALWRTGNLLPACTTSAVHLRSICETPLGCKKQMRCHCSGLDDAIVEFYNPIVSERGHLPLLGALLRRPPPRGSLACASGCRWWTNV